MENENGIKACVVIVLAFSLKRQVNRKQWSKKWFQDRVKYTHLNLLNAIRIYWEMDDYDNYFRMSNDCFENLLELVNPFLSKQDTIMRKAISAREKLALSLHYLATGRYFKDVRFAGDMSSESVSQAVIDTCESLSYVLRDSINLPTTANEWKSVAAEFEKLHYFYNCVGAIDGKHIKIRHPHGSGSLYYNYKRTYSIVLMAIVNAKKQFIMVDIGCNGRVSDGGVIFYTKFWELLQQGRLNLPEPSPLPNTVEPYPYVFIGDEAFALSPNLMKPYPHKPATTEEQIYNQRLSKARCVVECAFGILTTRFGVFPKTY